MIAKRKKTFHCSSLNSRGRIDARKRHQRQIYFRLSIGVFSLFLILFSIIYVFNSPFFAVSEIVFDRDEDNIKERQIILSSVISEKTENKIWGLFSRNNFLIFPKSEIADTIKERFSDLSNVSLGLVGFNKIVIKTEDRTPIFEICSISSECLFVDRDGFLFNRDIDFLSQDLLKIKVGWELEKSVVFDKQILERIKTIETLLKERGLKIFGVSISKFKDLEFDLGGADVFFDSDSQILSTMSNFDSVLKEAGGISVLDKIEYIDLRFGNKVFLKKR